MNRIKEIHNVSYGVRQSLAWLICLNDLEKENKTSFQRYGSRTEGKQQENPR